MERDDDEPALLMASSGSFRGIAASPTPNLTVRSASPAKLRSTLSVRPNLENSRRHGDSQHEFDAISEGSELLNESVVSSITDR